jgi:hypothetical protein
MADSVKKLQLGGIGYILQASKPLRAFHASWKCPACQTSTDCGVYSTAEAALDAAERQVRVHHAAAHQTQ